MNGLAYAPSDVPALAAAMMRLAKNPTLRHELQAGALTTAASLGWDRELDRLDSSYRDGLEMADHHTSFEHAAAAIHHGGVMIAPTSTSRRSA